MFKSRLKLVIVIIFLFGLISFSRVENVYATAASISPNGSGAGTSCSGTVCVSLATAGIRVAVLDSTGARKGNIVDYWFYNENNPGSDLNCNHNTTSDSDGSNLLCTLQGNIVYFRTRRMKQELRNKYISNDIYNEHGKLSGLYVKGTDNYTFNPIIGSMPGILKGMNRNWDDGSFDYADNQKNARVYNSASKIGNRIYGNIDDHVGGNVESDDVGLAPKKTYVKAILADTGSGLNIDNLYETYYIQVEPLIAFQNGTYNFYGTISEFTYFQVATKRYCDVANYGDPQGIGSPYFYNENCKWLYRTGGLGIHASDSSVIPNHIFTAYTGTTDNNQAYSKLASDIKGDTNTAAGVGFISLDKLKTQGCPSAINSYIGTLLGNNNQKNTSFKSNIISYLQSKGVYDSKYSWLANFTDYGFSNVSQLNSYVQSKSTCEITCNITAKNLLVSGMQGKGDTDEFKNIINFLKSKFTFPSKGAEEAYQYEAYGQSLNGVNTNKLCEKVTCDGMINSNKTRTLLTGMFKIFNLSYLNPEFLDALELTMNDAKCETTPECPAPKSVAKCGSNSNFTLSDTNKAECWKQGIAYNSLCNNSSCSTTTRYDQYTQTSAESEYGASTYCKETVNFEFPSHQTSSTSIVKAGRLIKWGTNSNLDSNIFGKMTVTRECTLNNKSTITSNWAKVIGTAGATGAKINPNIIVKYKEAIPNTVSTYNAQVLSSKLDTELTGVTITVGGTSYESESTNCGSSCSTKDSAIISAQYNLVYGKTFTWYSDKSDSFKNKTESELTTGGNTLNDSHVFIGYGLPTSFLTPSGTYGLDLTSNPFTNINSSNDSTGYMYVIGNHLGTKNGDGTYHFDKYLKFALTDDNTNNKTKLYYSCKFKIKNEMFGHECESDNVNKPDYCDSDHTPKGVDVVFRTIKLVNSNDSLELTKAFPGKLGGGRDLGKNWENKVTDNSIYDILSNSVYNGKTMYHINLTVGNIKNIRRFNSNARSKSKDPYTNMETNVNINEAFGFVGYKCSQSQTSYGFCASEFISKLMSDSNYDFEIYCKGDSDTSRSSDTATRANEGPCGQKWYS